MRRKISLFLIVVGILALGVRYFANQNSVADNPPGMEIRFIEYNPLSPNNSSSLGSQMQNLVDRISEAAMNGNWTTASQVMRQLDNTWQSVQPQQTQTEIEAQIQQAIQTLHYNVWGKDKQGVLTTAQKLTALISQLEA